MKTTVCLTVTESGRIAVGNYPVEPKYNDFTLVYIESPFSNEERFEQAKEKYQSALKEATANAVECKDQEQARDFIYSAHYRSLPVPLKPGQVYLIQGLSFTVETTCKWNGNQESCGNETCWDLQECQKSPEKKLALLSLEPDSVDKKIINAGRVIELMEAQKFLHNELGDDWNDLLKTLYEGRVLAAMYKFKHTNSKEPDNVGIEQEERPDFKSYFCTRYTKDLDLYIDSLQSRITLLEEENKRLREQAREIAGEAWEACRKWINFDDKPDKETYLNQTFGEK